MPSLRFTALLGAFAVAAFTAAPAAAQYRPHLRYTVKITNLSKQVLTPPVVASHRSSFRVFQVGGTANAPLYTLAETGSPALLADELADRHEVGDVVTGGGPIPPGESMTLQVLGSNRFPSFSVLGMLATTNDTFFAVQGQRLTRFRSATTAPAYDAGSEANNESCDYLPGPPCSGSAERMTEGAEGFIHRSGGIHGIADLEPADLDWRGDVALIEVYRVN